MKFSSRQKGRAEENEFHERVYIFKSLRISFDWKPSMSQEYDVMVKKFMLQFLAE